MGKALEMARELVKQLEKAEKENKVELSSLNPGETFKMGENDFIVLEQYFDRTKVISKNFMKEDVVFDDNTRNYAESNLKEVIEKDIQPIIESEIGEDNIIEHSVDLVSVDMQLEFPNCNCKVRPITFDVARKYNDLLPNDNLDDWWWTCTPWSTSERGWNRSIAVVSSSGYFSRGNCYGCNGFRPVCILKSNIFVSKGE